MSRAAPPDFFPPLDHPLVLWMADHFVVPFMQRRLGRVTRLELAPDDLARLQAAAQGPVMICPNHPTLVEPVLSWSAVRRAGLRANGIMAWQTMSQLGPSRGLVQRMGIYSVRRGTADPPSYTKTRELLAEGGAIVVFPEGETYGLHDTLLSFQEGVAQFGFWANEDRLASGRADDVTLVPMAFGLTYLKDMRPEIDRTLGVLERELGLPDGGALERYPRLRRIGFACLDALLVEFHLTVPEPASLDQKMAALFEHTMAAIAQRTGVRLDTAEGLQGRLRRLFVALHEPPDHDPSTSAETPYRLRLQEQRELSWQAMDQDLGRLQVFQAVSDGYVASHPTAERYLDVLGRLEVEILGRSNMRGPRRAEVRVGEPIRIAEWLERYQADRLATLDAVTAELRRRVMALLQEMSEATPTIEPPVALENAALTAVKGDGEGFL